MKKRRVVLVSLAAFILLAALGAFLWLLVSLNSITRQQKAAYSRFSALEANLETAEVEVTEGGTLVGVYSLEELGVADATRQALSSRFTVLEQLPPQDFAALGAKARLSWEQETRLDPAPLPVSLEGLDPSAVQLDLSVTVRHPSQDAYAYFADGAYHIQPEVQGNALRVGITAKALEDVLSRMTLTEDGPCRATLELTDYDCYEPPAVTVENGSFDYNAMLREETEGKTITVNLPGQPQTLEVAPLLSLDAEGRLLVDETALTAQIAQWAAAFDKTDTPYLFTTFADGLKPLSFLHCAYMLDQNGLRTELLERLTALNFNAVSAPYACTRNGEPFAISGTYVEVDIQKQQMTYYKDGEMLVHTDVVTGRKGGYDTPVGYYQVQTHSPNAWLTGPDYRVFVKYWVGFYQAYGIHDASWRTIFGGEKYIYDGSHGCVNTPEAAMKIIYDNITIGTPVVVH